MELWIVLSIAAAGFQTLRFMLQKQLSLGTVSRRGDICALCLFRTFGGCWGSCLSGMAWRDPAAIVWRVLGLCPDRGLGPDLGNMVCRGIVFGAQFRRWHHLQENRSDPHRDRRPDHSG